MILSFLTLLFKYFISSIKLLTVPYISFKFSLSSSLKPKLVVSRAANSVDFCIEFKFEFEFEFSLFYEFEFDIFIFASSRASSSSVKIYQVLSSLENKVIDSA